MCSLMMISDILSKHVAAVKSVLKKWFKINDIQLVHLLVVWYLVNLQDARCNNKDNQISLVQASYMFHHTCSSSGKHTRNNISTQLCLSLSVLCEQLYIRSWIDLVTKLVQIAVYRFLMLKKSLSKKCNKILFWVLTFFQMERS